MTAGERCRGASANTFKILESQKLHTVRTWIQGNARCRCRWGTACSPAPGCRSARGRPSWRLEQTENVPLGADTGDAETTRKTLSVIKPQPAPCGSCAADTSHVVRTTLHVVWTKAWAVMACVLLNVQSTCAVAVSAAAGAAALTAVAWRRPRLLQGHKAVVRRLNDEAAKRHGTGHPVLLCVQPCRFTMRSHVQPALTIQCGPFRGCRRLSISGEHR
jgi:hypothetical protein